MLNYIHKQHVLSTFFLGRHRNLYKFENVQTVTLDVIWTLLEYY